MYLLYSSPRRAPLTTMPSTLLLHSDCIARVTESMVVCPMRTTSRVPWHSVESRLASAANSSGGLSRMIQLKSDGSRSSISFTSRRFSSSSGLITASPAGMMYRLVPAIFADRLMQRHAAQQIIGDAGAAVDAEQRVNDGPAEIEIGQQRDVACQVRLRQREIGGGKRFAFGRRRAGDHQRMNRLQALHVIEARAQGAEFFHGRFVRPRHVDQQRIGGGAEGNFLDLLQQARQIGALIQGRGGGSRFASQDRSAGSGRRE